MDRLLCAMKNTAYGVIYDCQHYEDVAEQYNVQGFDKVMHVVMTRQNRFPYIMLWVIIISVFVLIMVLMCMIISLSRRARRHPYYFNRHK